MRRIVVVRHGETDWNLHGRMQGWAPVPLNGTGRAQADAVGRYLAREYDVDRVVASDLHRTRETTERVTAHVDAPVTYDRAWRERHIGVYQGLEYEDVVERFPEFALGETGIDAADRVPESGESLLDVRERVVEAWGALLDDETGSGSTADDGWETTLLVTHGGPIHLLLGHLKGMDARTSLREHSQSNCAVNELRVDDGVEVVRENATDWED